MKRDPELLSKRREYINQCVKASDKPITTVVKDISERLFITERTIWNDLKY